MYLNLDWSELFQPSMCMVDFDLLRSSHKVLKRWSNHSHCRHSSFLLRMFLKLGLVSGAHYWNMYHWRTHSDRLPGSSLSILIYLISRGLLFQQVLRNCWANDPTWRTATIRMLTVTCKGVFIPFDILCDVRLGMHCPLWK